MPYGISVAVWNQLPGQQQQNEADNFNRNEAGGRPYNLPPVTDDSGSRDHVYHTTNWGNGPIDAGERAASDRRYYSSFPFRVVPTPRTETQSTNLAPRAAASMLPWVIGIGVLLMLMRRR